MILRTNKEFRNRIEEIWHNPKFETIEIRKRGFAIHDDIRQNAIMFIGINPSYNNIPSSFYYDNSQGKIHPYFKKFIDISQKVSIDWTHLDLLFVRETSQNIIKDLGKAGIGHDFFDEQLKISKEIIETAKPQILVINNTYARDLLKSESFSSAKYDFEFDEIIGTERIVNHKILNGTPVFFTSMLSGQRALDLGSYDRLIWHIKYVKKILTNGK